MAKPRWAVPGHTLPQPSPWRDLAKVAMFFLVVVAAMVLWIRSLPREEKARSSQVVRAANGPAPPEMFVGARACADCHPGEYAAHSLSGHNRTLRPAGSGPLARLLDGQCVADPEEPDITWTYAVRDGRFFVMRTAGGVSGPPIPIDFAVGSGQHATTFVSELRAGEPGKRLGLEHRLTYFAHSKSLALTPGQHKFSKSGQSRYGYLLTPELMQDCINCHSTRTSARGPKVLDVETMIPNISCERCHGPGRSHVEKARSGAPSESLRTLLGPDGDASTEVRFCGICHRLPHQFSPSEIRPGNTVLARFPSVGLMQSKCYTASRGALRCTSCHDPHSRVSHEPILYENACLSCHRAAPQDTCSVSPESGCIACHMPKRQVGRGLEFSDHWIRKPAGPSH
jgi:hypothetical protein